MTANLPDTNTATGTATNAPADAVAVIPAQSAPRDVAPGPAELLARAHAARVIPAPVDLAFVAADS